MPPPANSIKLVFYGTLQGGEVFAHSQWCALAAMPDQAALDTLCQEARDDFAANVANASNLAFWANTTHWVGVRAYAYAGGSGVAALQSDQLYTTQPGGSAPTSLPNQICEVVTLLTGAPGRSNRGRTYLPALATSQVAAGQIATSTVNALATSYANFLTALRGHPDGAEVYVVSPTKSARRVITQVRVDSRFDVQRRRANKQSITTEDTVAVPTS